MHTTNYARFRERFREMQKTLNSKKDKEDETYVYVFGENFLYMDSRNYYIVNLDYEIDEPYRYRDFFKLCEELGSDETIILNINSPGGSLDTMGQMCNAILDSKAKVIANVYYAGSAAACVVLCCDEVNIKRFATMMFHAASWAAEGKAGEMKAQSDYLNHQDLIISNTLYSSIFSEDEMQRINEGKDYWLTEWQLKDIFAKWKPVKKLLK